MKYPKYYIHVKFNETMNNNIFEIGNNYYIDKGHDNESRINICNFLD